MITTLIVYSDQLALLVGDLPFTAASFVPFAPRRASPTCQRSQSALLSGPLRDLLVDGVDGNIAQLMRRTGKGCRLHFP